MIKIEHKIEDKNILKDFLPKIVGNQKILIDNGFYLDTSYRGKQHVKYIHDSLSDVYFNERGTDKIRHTFRNVFTRGTLKSSIAWDNEKFEEYISRKRK